MCFWFFGMLKNKYVFDIVKMDVVLFKIYYGLFSNYLINNLISWNDKIDLFFFLLGVGIWGGGVVGGNKR